MDETYKSRVFAPVGPEAILASKMLENRHEELGDFAAHTLLTAMQMGQLTGTDPSELLLAAYLLVEDHRRHLETCPQEYQDTHAATVKGIVEAGLRIFNETLDTQDAIEEAETATTH